MGQPCEFQVSAERQRRPPGAARACPEARRGAADLATGDKVTRTPPCILHSSKQIRIKYKVPLLEDTQVSSIEHLQGAWEWLNRPRPRRPASPSRP